MVVAFDRLGPIAGLDEPFEGNVENAPAGIARVDLAGQERALADEAKQLSEVRQTIGLLCPSVLRRKFSPAGSEVVGSLPSPLVGLMLRKVRKHLVPQSKNGEMRAVGRAFFLCRRRFDARKLRGLGRRTRTTMR